MAKRGRPPKDASALKRGPGRPRKNPEAAAPKRGPGRPRKEGGRKPKQKSEVEQALAVLAENSSAFVVGFIAEDGTSEVHTHGHEMATTSLGRFVVDHTEESFLALCKSRK